mgnify:CR=1 FL=1
MLGKALHTKSIWKSNLMTDIRLASEAGFGWKLPQAKYGTTCPLEVH